MTPVVTSWISWGKRGGKISKSALFIPGTAIKGPLAHRVAYYYNALKGIDADNLDPEEFNDHTGCMNVAVRELFGYPKNDTYGIPGKVYIDDVLVGKPQYTPKQKFLNHVSIDRFTGGARTMSGALFSEFPVFKGDRIPLVITVMDAGNIRDGVVKKAFRLALQDLAEGQLAIGGGTGRGNGFFESETMTWSDGGTWIGGDHD